MIVEFEYEYWGDNGRYYESRMEEFETEQQAADELGYTAYHNAIDDDLVVLRVIGGEDGAVERIQPLITDYLERQKKRDRIFSLQQRIKDHEKWFENLEGEKERRYSSLAEACLELQGLEENK